MLKKILFAMLWLLPVTGKIVAQTMVIGKPTFPFTQACANPGFNEFEVFINFNASTVDPNNQFIVELSNPEGDFTIPTVLYTSQKGQITTTGTAVKVAIPTTASGEKYQIRIKSTVPAATGQRSNAFAAYYKPHDTPFTINNSIPSAAYCSGGSYILAIDPNGNGVNNSPLQYSFLTYNWYKDNSTPTLNLPPTLVAGGTSGTYTVTQPGVYYVETNYGSCTSDSYSNRVTVTSSNDNGSVAITSSLGNPFCESPSGTILSTTAGQSYQWYKDGSPIAGATSKTYTATVAGTYSVNVNFGGCQATGSLALQVNSFNSNLNIPLSPDTNVITPGETLLVEITSDATNPTYSWYKDNVVINGANASSYNVGLKGTYKAVVTQGGSCTATKEMEFIVRYDSDPDPFPDVAEIPNIVSPNGDFVNDTWILPKEYANQENVEVLIIDNNGKQVLKTNKYQNDWPDSNSKIDFATINPVYYYIITTADNKVRKGSITVLK